MTEQSEPEEFRLAREAAEAALKPDSYDPFARAADRGYPVETITIYWDELSARELLDHDRALSQQSMVVGKFQADLASVPDLLRQHADDKAMLTKVKKAQKADVAKLQEEQAKYDEMEAAGLALRDRIKESAVTIHLSGFDGDAMDEIRNQTNADYPPVDVGDGKMIQNPGWERAYSAAIIARAIVWTQTAEQDEPSYTRIDPAVVLGWRKNLPEESYIQLTRAASKVTLATGIFRSLEDAGFLAKS